MAEKKQQKQQSVEVSETSELQRTMKHIAASIEETKKNLFGGKSVQEIEAEMQKEFEEQQQKLRDQLAKQREKLLAPRLQPLQEQMEKLEALNQQLDSMSIEVKNQLRNIKIDIALLRGEKLRGNRRGPGTAEERAKKNAIVDDYGA